MRSLMQITQSEEHFQVVLQIQDVPEEVRDLLTERVGAWVRRGLSCAASVAGELATQVLTIARTAMRCRTPRRA